MRRVRFGPTTDGTLDSLEGQIDTGNENGNNPDNDLVIRDNTGTIVARYNESATTWQLEQPLDLQSNNVTNVGALDTEEADITNATILQTSTGYETVEGTDPDDRLDNALSKASEGDAIYLENGEYSKERTGTDSIDVRVALYGVSQESGANNSTHHTADWTVTEIHQIKHVGGDATLRVEADRINISELTHTGDIEIANDNCMLFAINAATVTFEDGTSGNVIDASADVSVTDNGDNTVGDVT